MHGSADLVDREWEREELRRLAVEDGPRSALLYGRRRVGKTFLLDRVWPERRVFYYLAADSTPGMNREDLVRDFAAWSGRELLPEDYPSWRAAYRLFVEEARQEGLIVVLDEFQYLLGGEDDAASQLVAVWDREVGSLPLTLVLCGSEVSTMERLRGADQPLYGRFDWSHRLEPFDYLDASRFVPEWSKRDAAALYGVFGGMPQYLAAVAREEGLAAAVRRQMLRPGAQVRVQVENVIEQERGIRSPGEYRAVLAAVARGCTERNEIVNAANLTPENVRRILDRLQDLDLVFGERNFDAPANAAYRYRIADHALRFWHRFVHPYRSALETGEVAGVWEERIRPDLDGYLGKTFEGVCREGYLRNRDRWGLPAAEKWARWEGQTRDRRSVEVDVVGRLTSGEVLTGEIKWSSRPVGRSLHTELLRKLEAIAASGQAWAYDALPEAVGSRYIYFSAAGFTDAFRELAAGDERVHLVDLGDLFVGREGGDRQ